MNGTTPETKIKNRQKSKFRAEQSHTNQHITFATFTPVIFETVFFDIKGEFNPGTGAFTAAQAGYYIFTTNIGLTNLSNGRILILRIRQNALDVAFMRLVMGGTSNGAAGASCVLRLAAGDVMSVEVYHNEGVGCYIINSSGYTQFSGHRIS